MTEIIRDPQQPLLDWLKRIGIDYEQREIVAVTIEIRAHEIPKLLIEEYTDEGNIFKTIPLTVKDD